MLQKCNILLPFLMIKAELLRNAWKCFKMVKYIEKRKKVGFNHQNNRRYS